MPATPCLQVHVSMLKKKKNTSTIIINREWKKKKNDQVRNKNNNTVTKWNRIIIISLFGNQFKARYLVDIKQKKKKKLFFFLCEYNNNRSTDVLPDLSYQVTAKARGKLKKKYMKEKLLRERKFVTDK